MPNPSPETQWNVPLVQLLANLKIEQWDLLLIGDGSGSRWNYGIGWGCVAIEKGSPVRKVFYGGANDGTVNLAEPLAYLLPLSWYAGKIENSKERLPKYIHVITDSEYVRDRGSREQSATTGAHTVLWTAFEMLHRKGFLLHWHWINRETYALNSLVDVISKQARTSLASHDNEIMPEHLYAANAD